MCHALTYFDHACTSHPKPDFVWQTIKDYLNNIGVSPGRSGSNLSQKADAIIWDARCQVAKLFNVSMPQNIFFTQNCTHAINLILKGFLHSNDHVIVTGLEHNSVLRPLEKLRKERRVQYSVVMPNIEGVFDLQDFEKEINSRTKLIIVTHVSNAIGSITPIKEIGVLAKKHKCYFFVDVAQSAGLLEIDVERDKIDFLAFTGHKYLLGPSGVGGGYIRNFLEVDSFYEGGTGNNSLQITHPEMTPFKFEAGTENYLGIAALRVAVSFLLAGNLKKHGTIVSSLTQYCKKMLSEIEEITIYGPKEGLAVVSFNIAGALPGEIAHILDNEYNISTRSGILCAPLIHKIIGTLPHGVIRLSFGYNNKKEEIDFLQKALKEIISMNVYAVEDK